MRPFALRAATVDWRGTFATLTLTRTGFGFAGFAALDFEEVEEREEDTLDRELLRDPFCAGRSNGNTMRMIKVKQRTARFIMEASWTTRAIIGDG